MKRSKKPKGKTIRFQYVADPGSAVCLVGTFNSWDPAAHPLRDNPRDGVYAAEVFLQVGRHEYKFIVNGNWHSDPNCSESVVNEYGTLNSVITV